MKQITKDTVLKQGDKSYSAIEIKCNGTKIEGTSCSKNNLCIYPNCQGIVWIDKDANVDKDNWWLETITNTIHKKASTILYRIGENAQKIIAANIDLEGVPKIELEDEIEVEELARQWYKTKTFYTNNPNQRSINGFIAGYKANQTKYTEEEVEKMIIISNSDGRLTTKQEIKNFTSNQYAKQLLQSFNLIKEITVDENFKQI